MPVAGSQFKERGEQGIRLGTVLVVHMPKGSRSSVPEHQKTTVEHDFFAAINECLHLCAEIQGLKETLKGGETLAGMG